ncbi:hypothetical protein GCM10009765_23840 [Fodinicola feengrottensis]|uniref:SAF domain-containing protein n=2 Tax=Fodinicola feengrottensis TaxID=435914 RepID=A0ABP4SJ91_9ACTN
MVVCALIATALMLRADPRTDVLILVAERPVGYMLTAADMRSVAVAADPVLGAIPATERSSLVGHPLTAPLHADALITRSSVGDPAWPPAGQGVAGIALASGRYPPALAAGAQITVVTAAPSANPSSTAGAASGTGTESAATAMRATVVSVTSTDRAAGGADIVLQLILAHADALKLASLPDDQLAVVLVAPGSR